MTKRLGSLADGAASRARSAAKRQALSPEALAELEKREQAAETRKLFYDSWRQAWGRDFGKLAYEQRSGDEPGDEPDHDREDEPALAKPAPIGAELVDEIVAFAGGQPWRSRTRLATQFCKARDDRCGAFSAAFEACGQAEASGLLTFRQCKRRVGQTDGSEAA